MVQLLLDHMADPTARTAQGLTPREYLYYVERFTGEKNLKIESALRGKISIHLVVLRTMSAGID